jgi:ATP-dependent RNA helicase DHX29
MAPNKKKKKPVSNPARGFATTSLPSKAKPVEEPDKDTPKAESVTPSGGLAPDETAKPSQGNGAAPGNANQSDQAAGIGEMSPEELEAHLENSELETLVEKHALRCISDANRQVTRLEAERRQLRSQAYKLSTYAWLPEDRIDQVFAMQVTDTAVLRPNEFKVLPNSEEKLLIDLWTLERVLNSLQLSRVQEAVAHVAEMAICGQLNAVGDSLPGLSEALQWYASNLGADELSSYEHAMESKPGQRGNGTPQEHSGRCPIILRR